MLLSSLCVLSIHSLLIAPVYLVLGSRHATSYTFFHRETSSGWDNEYVAWNLGLLTCVWSFTGFDGTVHMSEETKKAKQAVPRATLYSIMLNGALGYCMAITLATCMGPMEDVLNSGFPVATILLRITGSVPATTALICGLVSALFFKKPKKTKKKQRHGMENQMKKACTQSKEYWIMK